MPILSSGYGPPPSPQGPSALQINGPTIAIHVAVPLALEQQLIQQSKPVPAPKPGIALIDTGASISAVDDSLIRSLGVSPIGLTNVGTPAGPTQQSLYPARFIFPNAAPLQIDFSRVLGSNLAGQPIIALLGRDALAHMLLVYNGVTGHYTVAI